MTNICELCQQPVEGSKCRSCQSMNHDELIEAAHKTIRDWKKLVTAAAIENGSQLRVSDRSINQARGHVLHIYHNQTHHQTIIDAEPESP